MQSPSFPHIMPTPSQTLTLTQGLLSSSAHTKWSSTSQVLASTCHQVQTGSDLEPSKSSSLHAFQDCLIDLQASSHLLPDPCQVQSPLQPKILPLPSSPQMCPLPHLVLCPQEIIKHFLDSLIWNIVNRPKYEKVSIEALKRADWRTRRNKMKKKKKIRKQNKKSFFPKRIYRKKQKQKKKKKKKKMTKQHNKRKILSQPLPSLSVQLIKCVPIQQSLPSKMQSPSFLHIRTIPSQTLPLTQSELSPSPHLKWSSHQVQTGSELKPAKSSLNDLQPSSHPTPDLRQIQSPLPTPQKLYKQDSQRKIGSPLHRWPVKSCLLGGGSPTGAEEKIKKTDDAGNQELRRFLRSISMEKYYEVISNHNLKITDLSLFEAYELEEFNINKDDAKTIKGATEVYSSTSKPIDEGANRRKPRVTRDTVRASDPHVPLSAPKKPKDPLPVIKGTLEELNGCTGGIPTRKSSRPTRAPTASCSASSDPLVPSSAPKTPKDRSQARKGTLEEQNVCTGGIPTRKSSRSTRGKRIQEKFSPSLFDTKPIIKQKGKSVITEEKKAKTKIYAKKEDIESNNEDIIANIKSNAVKSESPIPPPLKERKITFKPNENTVYEGENKDKTKGNMANKKQNIKRRDEEKEKREKKETEGGDFFKDKAEREKRERDRQDNTEEEETEEEEKEEEEREGEVKGEKQKAKIFQAEENMNSTPEPVFKKPETPYPSTVYRRNDTSLFSIKSDACPICCLYAHFFTNNSETFMDSLNKSLPINENMKPCTHCSDNMTIKVPIFLNEFSKKIENDLSFRPEHQAGENFKIHLSIEKIAKLVNKYCPSMSHELGITLICGVGGQYNWDIGIRKCVTEIMSLFLEDLFPNSENCGINESLSFGLKGRQFTNFFYKAEDVQTQIRICEIIWFLIKRVKISSRAFFSDKEPMFKNFITNIKGGIKFEQEVRSFVNEENKRVKKSHCRNDRLPIVSYEFNDFCGQPSKVTYGNNPHLDINYRRETVSIIVTIDNNLQVLEIPFSEMTLKETIIQESFIMNFTGGNFRATLDDLKSCRKFLSRVKFEKESPVNNAKNDRTSNNSEIVNSPVSDNHSEHSPPRIEGDDSDDDVYVYSKESTIELSFSIKPEDFKKFWTPEKHTTSRYLNRTEVGLYFPKYYESPCLVMCKQSYVKSEYSRKRNVPWARAKGYCTICNATHSYKIQQDPFEEGSFPEREIEVDATIHGSFMVEDGLEADVRKPDHKGKKPLGRQLRGHERENMGRLASKLGSDATFNDQMAFLRDNEIDHQNFESIKNINQIKQSRYEQEKQLRGGATQYEAVKNYQDCNSTIVSKNFELKSAEKFPGLVRHISEDPFRVEYWKFDQLKICLKYLNSGTWKKPTFFYIDFTGHIWYDKDKIGKDILNGAIVIPPAVPGTSPFAVAEWASNSNTTRDCKLVLVNLLSDLRIVNNHLVVKPPQIIVIDIAWHLLHSVLEEIINTNVREYIKKIYKYFNEGENTFPYLSLVIFCKNHFLPAWVKSSRAIGPNKAVADIFVASCLLMANCEEWTDAVIVYKAIIQVFGSKLDPEEASQVIAEKSKKILGIDINEMDTFIDSCLDEEIPTYVADGSIAAELSYTDNSIRNESPFKSYFESLFNNLIDKEEDCDLNCNDTFFAPQLIRWFLKQWLPLSPFFLRAVLPRQSNGQKIEQPTNAFIELWWKKEKTWYEGTGPSLMYPPKILTIYSDKIDQYAKAYILHEKNPSVKLGTPRKDKVKKVLPAKTFVPTSSKRGKRQAKHFGKIGRETVHSTPPKQDSQFSDPTSERRRKESWKRARGSGKQTNTGRGLYFGGKVVDPIESIRQMQVKENIGIKVTGHSSENWFVPPRSMFELAQDGQYVDDQVIDAGIALLNKELEDENLNVQVIPIGILRIICGPNFEEDAIGIYKEYLNGRKPFVTILPRFLDARAGSGHHFTLITSMECEKNTVKVYETLNAYRNEESEDHVLSEDGVNVVKKLLGTKYGEEIKIILENVLPQSEAECGAISLALCYRLLFCGTEGPMTVKIKDPRAHLQGCLIANKLSEFPSINRPDVSPGPLRETKILIKKTSKKKITWQEEKKMMLGLSKEERRKNYFCGDKFVKLEDVKTWKKDSRNKFKLVNQKLKEELITEEMNMGLDLSEKVSLFVGDITTLEIDSIVNAANKSLLGGGGVDGAINRAAGKNLIEENKTLGGCSEGEAKLSGGYRLPAKYIISTVGPQDEHSDILKNAYNNSLQVMLDNKLRSIAFPCISTGIYGYPIAKAVNIALETTRIFLEKHHENVDRIIFCMIARKNVKVYEERMPIIFPFFENDAEKAEHTDKN